MKISLSKSTKKHNPIKKINCWKLHVFLMHVNCLISKETIYIYIYDHHNKILPKRDKNTINGTHYIK